MDIKTLRAIEDVKEAFRIYPIWLTLGWYDVKQKYRRSKLGPWWITLSLAFWIAGMGVLYSRLFHQNLSDYFPYLTIGLVLWSFLSSLITDSCNVFISSEGILKQIPLPIMFHVLRMIWKQIIIFFHNFLAVIIVLFLFRVPLHFTFFLLPFSLVLILFNALWVGLLLGIFCARFRDIPQIVSTFVQILFFMTPVMWRPESLGTKQWIATWNPMYHMIVIFRGSILENHIQVLSWVIVTLTAAFGWIAAFSLFVRYRGRVAFWI